MKLWLLFYLYPSMRIHHKIYGYFKIRCDIAWTAQYGVIPFGFTVFLAMASMCTENGFSTDSSLTTYVVLFLSGGVVTTEKSGIA
jgi:hypothetical protein